MTPRLYVVSHAGSAGEARSADYNKMPRALHGVSQSLCVPTVPPLLFACASAHLKAHTARRTAHCYSTNVAPSRSRLFPISHFPFPTARRRLRHIKMPHAASRAAKGGERAARAITTESVPEGRTGFSRYLLPVTRHLLSSPMMH